MSTEQQSESLQALRDIRGIMDRSARFLSLSGWSGIWAGCTALCSAAVAGYLIRQRIWEYRMMTYRDARPAAWAYPSLLLQNLFLLAAATFVIAFAGAFFFTWRKARANGQTIWNSASRRLAYQVALPVAAGGVFCFSFLYYEVPQFIAPACLMFYGLALINGSKYTLHEIRVLGFLEMMLGCICLFAPGWALLFWTAGFGALHILYGIIMWNKYDKNTEARTA